MGSQPHAHHILCPTDPTFNVILNIAPSILSSHASGVWTILVPILVVTAASFPLLAFLGGDPSGVPVRSRSTFGDLVTGTNGDPVGVDAFSSGALRASLELEPSAGRLELWAWSFNRRLSRILTGVSGEESLGIQILPCPYQYPGRSLWICKLGLWKSYGGSIAGQAQVHLS